MKERRIPFLFLPVRRRGAAKSPALSPHLERLSNVWVCLQSPLQKQGGLEHEIVQI